MTRWIVTGLAALVLVGTSAASADPSRPSAPPASALTSTPSAYDSLSPGNKRIATALFEAQKSNTSAPSMTLDQIAHVRRSGKSWGEIFQIMKSQGLVQAETLGQVIGRYDRARHTRL
jgi:hypothetical protein